MRLAQLSVRYPPAPGGVERHVREISHRLVARGYQVLALASDLYREFPLERLSPEVPRREVDEGVEVRRIPVFSLPGDLHYPFFRGLGRTLVQAQPDLVHVHTYGTHPASVASRYSRRHGVPWILTAHYHPIWSIWGGRLRHRIRGFYDRRLAGPIVQSASCVIVQSHEEERLMRQNGFALPRVALIPPGYTPLKPLQSPPQSFAQKFGIDGPFVLFVGRLASNKGLLALLEGFRPLARRDPTARLVLVGEDGGMRAAVELRARELGLASRIRLTGFIPEEGVLATAFAQARLFVLPSEYEAFGLVLLEALAQGTPVIASRVGGIPEFIEDGRAGSLIPPQNAGALSDALLELWDDESARRKLGEYGRTEVVPRYSWPRMVDQLEALYGEVLIR